MNNIECDLAYIYLLQDGDDKGTHVYKIGRTIQTGGDSRKLKRFQGYSKGTVIHHLWKVREDVLHTIENMIKEECKQRYLLVRGMEWFEGDVKQMKKDIDRIIDKFEEIVTWNENDISDADTTQSTYGGLQECNARDVPKIDNHDKSADTEVSSVEKYITQCDPFKDMNATTLHKNYVEYCENREILPKNVVHFARSLSPFVETRLLTRRMKDGRSVYSKK